MLTGLTKKEEERGFWINGVRYYRHNDYYYYATSPSGKQIRIQKHAFVRAVKRWKGEVTENE